MTLWDRITGTAQTVLDTLKSAVGSGEGGPGIAFTIAVIALSAKMAKADGVVTPDEVEAFSQVFAVDPQDAAHVSRVFNMARRDVAGFDSYARQIAQMFEDNPGVLEDLMDGLFHIARADGVVHEDELIFLRDVAGIFGFSDFEFARIRATNTGEAVVDPYLVLGVTPDASDADLKRAYRRAVSENHPDRLMARGVPPEFVALANDKLATINMAWGELKKLRSIT
ncbi:molecular chaperone DjiA [Pyruvatibacter sp.]|uniref:molecular chaperone DjiA n=1 Tax=Pyruvatibacter sp. TaxID=1981328 RepID=UPI0032EB6F92